MFGEGRMCEPAHGVHGALLPPSLSHGGWCAVAPTRPPPASPPPLQVSGELYSPVCQYHLVALRPRAWSFFPGPGVFLPSNLHYNPCAMY